jgi:hypothetical protein
VPAKRTNQTMMSMGIPKEQRECWQARPGGSTAAVLAAIEM